ncbi:MAG TPA: alpha/beta fold hydrolase [Herpetosiphonaceae bacterium]|nr:alpha/beta fold hydrolase [Herpetosiphonaceae bacterium]
MEARQVTVNGIQMRWQESGTGLPVVLIHGIPTCPQLWRHVVPHLHGARALAWEMVGYGASIPEGHGRDISVGQQAEYLVAWLREIGVERAVLVGHDLGGGVAQIAAVRHPEFVQGLVLMNSIAYDSWPIPSVKVMRVLSPAVRHLPDAIFRQVFRLFLLQGHTTWQQAWEAFGAHWPHYATHGGAAAFIRQVRALDVRDTLAIADQLSNLNVPARLVWGAADQFQQIGYGYGLAHDLRARLDRIEGGKHFVPEDHPGRVATAVNDLVAEIPSTR